MTLDQIEQSISRAGLAVRGSLSLAGEERSGLLADRRHLVLVGFVGRSGWDAFASSPEAVDGSDDPLDRWSLRVLSALAQELGAVPLFPFGGPPYWPFQRWARRAEPLHPSPLGLLIHPVHGLWHSYRGALAFRQDLPPRSFERLPSPCESCAEQPCLRTCPVGAFSSDGYDVDTCARWLRTGQGRECVDRGCKARSACPVGRDAAHGPDQARFGMAAFLKARD